MVFVRSSGFSRLVEPLKRLLRTYHNLTDSVVAAHDWDIYTGYKAPYEQPGDILRRMRRFVARMRRQYPEQHVVAVTHGDPIVFTMLWTRNKPATRQALADLGLPEPYLAPASITTFAYKTNSKDEVPDFEYVKPY